MRIPSTFYLVIAMAGHVDAQTGPVTTMPEGHHLTLNDSIANLIGLRPDQMPAWRDLNDAYEEQYRDLKPGATFEEDRRKWGEQRNEDLKKFLTPDQYQKWLRLNSETRGEARPGGDPSRGERHPSPERTAGHG